jgi:hypothetical protein
MRNFFDIKSGEMDVASIIIMVSISAVTIMVGYFLMANMETSSMPSMTNSVLSTSNEVILTGFGNASTMLAFGLFVLAAVMITGLVMGIAGRGE